MIRFLIWHWLDDYLSKKKSVGGQWIEVIFRRGRFGHLLNHGWSWFYNTSLQHQYISTYYLNMLITNKSTLQQ